MLRDQSRSCVDDEPRSRTPETGPSTSGTQQRLRRNNKQFKLHTPVSIGSQLVTSLIQSSVALNVHRFGCLCFPFVMISEHLINGRGPLCAVG